MRGEDSKKGQISPIGRIGHIGPILVLADAIIDSGLAEEVFAGLLCDEAELFEFEIGALDFAFIDGEFLRKGGG